MLRSNRGVARVSIVWIISAGVLFLVAVAFAFIASSDLAAERDKSASAMSQRTNMEEQRDAAFSQLREYSRVMGWYDTESADPRTDVAAAKQAIVDLADTFPDLGDEDDDVQKVLPKIVAAFGAKNREIANLSTQIQSLENEATVAASTLSQVSSDKDSQIATLRQQLADELQTANSRNEDLERRLTGLQQQLSDRDLELRRAQNDLVEAQRSFDKEKIADQTRMRDLTRVASFAKDPFNRYPDGKVLDVSTKLPLAWIDIGSNQRLVRGLTFRIEGGVPGNRRTKGTCEVTEVQANMAQVVITSLVDEFDPIATGDVIINPLYDPSGGRNAILVGRFSGAYNRGELTMLLERMGIQVQDSLDATTHFMIVGSEIYTDEETGEPLDDPISPSDLPVYKDAIELQVQVIPLQDIREFFKNDTVSQR